MRHFRASLASLPLLGQAIGSLPIGTWSPNSSLVRRELNGGQQVEMLYFLVVIHLQQCCAVVLLEFIEKHIILARRVCDQVSHAS